MPSSNIESQSLHPLNPLWPLTPSDLTAKEFKQSPKLNPENRFFAKALVGRMKERLAECPASDFTAHNTRLGQERDEGGFSKF